MKGNTLNKRELELEEGNSSRSLHITFKTRASASTNNSSFEENKNINYEKNDSKKNNQFISEKINNNVEISPFHDNSQVRNGYNTFNIKNNFNYPYFVNINFNGNYFLNNNNYIYNLNINIYNYNCMLKSNYYLYSEKFKINKNNLKNIEIKIKALENKS